MTIDELLSGEKLLSIAEKENKSNMQNLCSILIGAIDLFHFLLIVLPLYPKSMKEYIASVNLFGYTETSAFDRIVYTDFYDIAFEQMNSTHSHNIDMDAGESIKVKIISKSGKISVQIYNEDDQPVYRGDDVTDAEFEIQINEKGTYRLCVSGKDAKGRVIFSRCKEEKDIKKFVIYLTSYR